MALHPFKKPKISKEYRLFHFEWELEFFFVEDRGKNVCLICRETIASNKRGNLERHYNKKHGDFTGIVGETRQIKFDQMKKV